ncbi:hypothetical protein JB92DRAFT_3141391, partial [Gautieria morchelliformis]
RTIKRHLHRDAEGLELTNTNHIENDTGGINLDGDGNADSFSPDPETLPGNYILAVDTRETQEIKGNELYSYGQDDDGAALPVHQFALDNSEPLSALFSPP